MKKLIITVIILLIYLGIFPTMLGDVNSNDKKWSHPEVVSTESTNNAYRASLAVDSNRTVHMAWKDKANYDGSGSDWDVFYKYKPWGGNWSTTEVVSTESGEDSHCLSLAIDYNDAVHVVWKDEMGYMDSGDDADIFYKYKPWGGNWSTTEVVSTESTGDCNCPSITVDDRDTVYVTWPDGTDYDGSSNDRDIFYKYKPWGGNWSTTEVVSTESNNDSLVTSLAVSRNGACHVAWEEKSDYDNSGVDYNIFYKYKPWGGNWSTTKVVSTESTSNSFSPSIDVDSNNTVHVLWVDRTNYLHSGVDYDTFYKYKPWDGNWSTTKVVSTESTSNCMWPFLKIDHNDTIHAAWSDATNLYNSGTDYDIFYKNKSKNGSWSDTEIASIVSNYDSNWPSFDIDTNGTVYMSWWDDISGGHWTTFYNERCNKYEEPVLDNPKENGNEIPGFELIIAILSMLLIFFVINRNQ